jgi:hypothetical protein
MRGLLACLAAILITGCYRSTDPAEIIGTPDATVDPDVRRDPDARPDPVDPRWDDPGDPRRDDPPWPDLPPDPGTDCVGLTGGICSIVDQCGCLPGFACDFAQDSSTCTIIEDCMASSGTLEVEEECFGAGMCRPGTSCLCRGEDCRCQEWCVDSSDCSMAGRECNVNVSFTMADPCTGVGTIPYMACEIGCDEDAGCDLFATGTDPTGCPSGQACAMDNPVSSGGCDIRYCMPEGTGDEGDECSESMTGCRRGMGCYGNDTDGYHCWPYCDDTHACSSGTCHLLSSTRFPTLGICIP